MYRLPLAVLVGLLLLIAACSGTPANNSPGANATADGGNGAAGTDAGGDDGSATETEDADDDGGAANPGGATDLEALLPDEVNGIQLSKSSFSGADDFEAAGFNVDDLAAAADASPEDVALAMANDENGQIIIFAFRIEGRSAEETVDALLESDTTGLAEAVEERNVDGKDVLVSDLGATIYLYAAGDVAFQILADAESAEDALSQLP